MSLLDLFRPQWKHSRPAVRAAAVRGINNSDLLAEIARTDSDRDVRIAAVRMLTSQTVLVSIARSDGNDGVRKAAVEKLKDQALLAEGSPIEDPGRFATRLTSLLEEVSRGAISAA